MVWPIVLAASHAACRDGASAVVGRSEKKVSEGPSALHAVVGVISRGREARINNDEGEEDPELKSGPFTGR